MYKLLIMPVLLFALVACSPTPPSKIAYEELPDSGDAVNGENLFTVMTCEGCHVEDATGSPLLDGIWERAGSIVEGQSARKYLFYSIVEPWQYVAEEYGNAMPHTYDDTMTPQEIADLIEYLIGL